MNLDFEWLDAAAPASDGWDAVVEEGGLVGIWRRAALAAYARGGLRETHLAIARVGDVPAALFCFVAGLSTLPARRYVRPGSPRGPRPLLCRLPVSFSPGYHFAPGLPLHHRIEVVRRLAAAVAARFGFAVPALGFLGVPASDLAAFDWCPMSVVLSPVAVVDVPPGGAEEFLRAQSRHRRRRLAEAVEQAQHGRLALFSGWNHGNPVLLSDLDRATRLRHVGNRRVFAPLPPAFLAALMEADSARLFGAHEVPELHVDPATSKLSPAGAQVQFFDLLLPGRDDWLALTTGSSADLEGRDVLAAAAFLRELDAVAASGATRLTLGPGSLPTKVRMGARLTTVHLQIAPLLWRRGDHP